MATTPTLDELHVLVNDAIAATSDADWHKSCGVYDAATRAAEQQRKEARAAVEAAHKALLERIAELEAALRAVLPWLLHEIEYPGDPVEKVANGVRALLSKEA